MVDDAISRPDGENNSGGAVGAGSPRPVEAGEGGVTPPLQRIQNHLRAGGRLWLFLDYDGTLVPYAPTPAQACPDQELIVLLTALANRENIRTVVLSGRALDSLQAMLPVPGLTLAGLYGVEIQKPGDGVTRRVQAEMVRDMINRVKVAWAQLIDGRSGFLLEDKGMAVALHSRLANAAEADIVVPQAQAVVTQMASPEFRVLSGDRFLEIAPAVAHKGETVNWFLEHIPFANALPIYFGDDDKDEEAFAVIRKHDGIPILVGARQPDTVALVRLPSPVEARVWLRAILDAAQ